jgi:N-acetylglutamate synthase/N-acetylornithine aminotransferase
MSNSQSKKSKARPERGRNDSARIIERLDTIERKLDRLLNDDVEGTREFVSANVLEAIEESRAEFRAGKWRPAEELLAELKTKKGIGRS